MNKIIFFVALLFSFNLVYSQTSFTIEDTNHVNVVNDTVYVSGDVNSYEIIEEFIVTNTSSSTLTVKAKKNDIFLVDSSEHVFCWVLCYSSTTFISNFSLIMTPGYSTVGAENLSSHYRPDSMSGTSIVTLTVFDVNNPADSAMVTVIFDAVTSIDNTNVSQEYYFKAPYPNPSNTQATFNYNFKDAEVYLDIYDILGNKIGKYKLNGNKYILDTKTLHSGTYFYTITVDGERYKTNRLIIVH